MGHVSSETEWHQAISDQLVCLQVGIAPSVFEKLAIEAGVAGKPQS